MKTIQNKRVYFFVYWIAIIKSLNKVIKKCCVLSLWAQKKGLRRVPTFVNLKSNTMKNIAKVLILKHIAKFYRAFLALLQPKHAIF